MFNFKIPQNRIKQKNKFFWHFFQTYLNWIIISNINSKLFLFHLKFFNFLFINYNKKNKKKKKKRLSKKQQFKKTSEFTTTIYTFSTIQIKKISILQSLNYVNKRYKFRLFPLTSLNSKKNLRSIYIINLRKLPFFKKTLGSRMGKGIGRLKTWYVNISRGWPTLYLYGWNLFFCFKFLKKLKKLFILNFFLSFSVNSKFLFF